MLAALVERWRPETHTFVLSIGEVTVTLEDVAHIFGLPIDGEPRYSVVSHHWVGFDVLETQSCWTLRSPSGDTRPHMPMRNIYHCFAISSGSVLIVRGSACLAHLYRALCRASQYDTKEMDGPLNLLFVCVGNKTPFPLEKNTFDREIK
ncbi:hypothetical protein AHAS_Ahas01G0060500 [Arachis hypogaea]